MMPPPGATWNQMPGSPYFTWMTASGPYTGPTQGGNVVTGPGGWTMPTMGGGPSYPQPGGGWPGSWQDPTMMYPLASTGGHLNTPPPGGEQNTPIAAMPSTFAITPPGQTGATPRIAAPFGPAAPNPNAQPGYGSTPQTGAERSPTPPPGSQPPGPGYAWLPVESNPGTFGWQTPNGTAPPAAAANPAMSQGSAPWSAALAGGYPMPAFTNPGAGTIPSQQAWYNMTPTEQQAVAQLNQSTNGMSAADLQNYLNQSGPQWGNSYPAQYQSY